METGLEMDVLSVSSLGVHFMNKESFEAVKERITREEFRSTLEQFDREGTLKNLNLNLSVFKYLVHIYQAEDIIEQLKQQKRKIAYQKKAEEKLQQLKDKISFEALVDFYITQNHSVGETAKWFQVTERNILQLIKLYDCKKPKTLSKSISFRTKEQRYGSATYNNREQAAQTCLQKYGVDNPSKVPSFLNTAYLTKVTRYGADNPNNWIQGHKTRIQTSGSLEESYRISAEHRKQYCLKRYGVDNTAKLDSVKKKIKNSVEKTFQERYGVNCYWLTDNAIRSSGSKDSSFNKAFSALLDSKIISYQREVKVGNFIYDFQIQNCLIEINPTFTHNVTWNPFSDSGIAKDYHQRKSINAKKHGYRCIHIWDWDNKDKILMNFINSEIIYARNCQIRLLEKSITDEFLNSFHFQGTCLGQTISLGLFYNDQLVQVMTFGKPRYNKKFEYELLRLCTFPTYKVVGGAQKLFKYFIKQYNPESIISYCDNSKFTGDVYTKLGMIKTKEGIPTRHWYNYKLNYHITDNLLRQRGFDQLFRKEFGTFGKGTNNDELMRRHDFVEIYDCGQSRYEWHKNI